MSGPCSMRRVERREAYDSGVGSRNRSRVILVWKAQVVLAASAYRQRFDVPVMLEAEFYLPRPKTRKQDEYCQTKPDIDNLLKSTMDALSQAGVWRDDAQVVAVVASKRYESANHGIGAVIKVTALEAEKMPQIKNGGV